MMRHLFCLLLFLAVPKSFATSKDCAGSLAGPGVLKCTLSSGSWSATVDWNLDVGDLEDSIGSIEQPGSDDHDLSIWIEATLHDDQWRGDVLLSSVSIQDEFRTHGLQWKDGARGEILRRTVDAEDAPDGKPYLLVCVVE